MEENSFSIINKTNGQITGEKANALPVKVITNSSWVTFLVTGFVLAFLVMVAILWFAKKQVAVVEVTGKADTYEVLQLN